MNDNEFELDSLYAEWSDDRSAGQPKPLKEWVMAHPEQAQSLVAWASAESVFQVAEERSVYAISEERAQALGASVLAEVRGKMEASSRPLQSIVATAKERGLSVKTLAQRIGVGVTLVAKLQDRLLVANSVPNALVERLSEALDVTAEQIRAYLQLPPQLAKGAMYKSADVPVVGAQQEFEKAIESALDMSAAEKAFWKGEAQASIQL